MGSGLEKIPRVMAFLALRPKIKIATILLIAVFIYDIFMVFITPLFTKEGESVMVTVATSGGPPEDPFILAILAGPDRVGPEVVVRVVRERLVGAAVAAVVVRDVDEREDTLEEVRGAEAVEGAAAGRLVAPLGRPPAPPPPPPALPNSASRFAEWLALWAGPPLLPPPLGANNASLLAPVLRL